MKAVVQRVLRGAVSVDGRVVGSCGRGMVVLLGVMEGDGPDEARRLAERIAGFRFFADEAGRMTLDVTETGGGALVVSQVTLAADGRKGRRPSLDSSRIVCIQPARRSPPATRQNDNARRTEACRSNDPFTAGLLESECTDPPPLPCGDRRGEHPVASLLHRKCHRFLPGGHV